MLANVLLVACLAAPMPPTSVPSPRQLAGDVSATLRSMRFAKVEATTIMESKGREIAFLDVRADMAPGKLYCELRDRQSTLVTAYALSDARVQEFVTQATPVQDLDWTIRNVVTEFDAPMVDGSDNSVFYESSHCLHGSWMQSWVGPASGRATLLARFISESEITACGDDAAPRYKAVRVRTETEPDGGVFTITQEIHVDPATSIPVAWHTTQETRKDDEIVSSMRMSRVFTIRPCEPDRTDWRLDAKRLAPLATPPAQPAPVAAASEGDARPATPAASGPGGSNDRK